MPTPIANRPVTSTTSTETAIPVRIPPSATTHSAIVPVVVPDSYAPSRAANPFSAETTSRTTRSTSEAVRLNSARKAIVTKFRDEFVNSPEFQSSLGPKTWADVKSDVKADARSFGTGAGSEVYNDADGSTTFTDRIYGLYTEARVNAQGKVDKVYFEID